MSTILSRLQTDENHQLTSHKKQDSQLGDMSTLYLKVRQSSVFLCEPLEIEDYGVQTMASISPPKWHLAHMSWFFETLLLKPYFPDYIEFDPHFARLFNSYYESLGDMHLRPERGLMSRPTVAEVYRYRQYIDEHMLKLLSEYQSSEFQQPQFNKIRQLTLLGISHEQQHQELLLTDIKHILSYNVSRPKYRHAIDYQPTPAYSEAQSLLWITFQAGVRNIGHHTGGFSYDNEMPQHKVYIEAFQLASRPVTNGEFIEFLQSGAYLEPELWLSDAWSIVKQQQWSAPLYWEKQQDQWYYMTLYGLQPVDYSAPACHVSYYEAAAYARWAGKRLPTEMEWEIAASDLPLEGNLGGGQLQPQPVSLQPGLQQMFGDVWEWTQSAYCSYPGYHQASGPLGEYNGKFMSNQMVLRGGSCVTPENHIRASYRNYFYPVDRWQFSGFRLAEDG